jgi:hypothetical protein
MVHGFALLAGSRSRGDLTISVWRLLLVGMCLAQLGCSTRNVPKEVVSIVLDHPSVEKYLHPELPDRVPVILSTWLIESCEGIRKFGRPVLALPDKDIGNRPHFRFTKSHVQKNFAEVYFEYVAEGMHGFARVRRVGNQWTVEEIELGEYAR